MHNTTVHYILIFWILSSYFKNLLTYTFINHFFINLLFICFRLETQNSSALEKNQMLAEELVLERKTSAILRNELDTVNNQQGESNRYEASRLESMLQRYEQRVFDLEELEVELREKVMSLQYAFKTIYWFCTYVVMSGAHLIPSLPAIANHSSETQAEYTKRNMVTHEVRNISNIWLTLNKCV